MKRVILSISALFIMAALNAQTKQKQAKAKGKIKATKTVTAKKSTEQSQIHTKTITLNSTNTASAKAGVMSIPTGNLTISDPILLTLDARAAGADIKISKSGIVGMPKRAYGIANGKIFLGTTSSVTSGTQTGSGGVGTGTSLATFGSIAPSMGVNGKSPYAGLNMWGNATNITINKRDSSVRTNPSKQ